LYDLDLYSSTRDALKIFDNPAKNFLPRVRCYFDDILGNELSLNNEFVGESLAIHEFNNTHESIKIASIKHLLAKSYTPKWYHKCFAAHLFDHPEYEKFITR
jgi:hypothetical protein